MLVGLSVMRDFGKKKMYVLYEIDRQDPIYYILFYMLTQMLQYKKTGVRPSRKNVRIMFHTRKDLTLVDTASGEVIVCFIIEI